MAEIITNQEELLSTVVNKILPSSEKLFFLTGFFYFSGFREIYENIKDKELKILVGMDIERDLNNKIVEVNRVKESSSNYKIRQDYLADLKGVINDTDYLDSPEQEVAFKVFVDKIMDGTLEIRKTHLPAHSKFYIFANKEGFSQGGLFLGTVIHGSSNLTGPGFVTQIESNTLHRDNESFGQFKGIFDKYWQDSVVIADKDNFEEFKREIVEKVWVGKLPSPYHIYLRVLSEFFAITKDENLKLPSEITGEKFSDLKYQVDAIQQSINILNTHNGVIIADVVGLGKSIIASAIAHNLGLRVIVIAPPHLVPQWEEYREFFKFDAQVFSNGVIDQIASKEWSKEERLVIIDEAHKYRNELTRDYADLHKICQGNKTVLLTATPFNNDPKDIFSMIKLFQIPAKSTIQTLDSLSFRFKNLVSEYNSIKKDQRSGVSKEKIKERVNALATQIRDLLAPLLIRRSRLDLLELKEYREDLERQNISFPVVNPPEILEYELGVIGGLYKKTLDRLVPAEGEGFIGSRYNPLRYLPVEEIEKIAKDLNTEANLIKSGQVNLAKFMKRLLVHRFESSIYAFERTLNNIISSYQETQRWLDKGMIPIFKKGDLPDVDSLFDEEGDEAISDINKIEDLLSGKLANHAEKGLILIDASKLSPEYREHLLSDLKLLEEIKDEWFSAGIIADPKAEHIKKHVKAMLEKEPDRKVVIFSEYSDTADDLFRQFSDSGLKVFKYSAADSCKENKEIIRRNFDAGYSIKDDSFDVLIATDAISEGYNLHRAGTIINYDIPYNPTRVIQRVGRINRINKKVFNELFIFNFFPTLTGEIETHTRQITTLKISLIHALLGEDTQYLTTDEELKSFYATEFKDELSKTEELSWDIKFRNVLENAKAEDSDGLAEASSLPKRCRIARTEAKTDKKGVIVFGRKGNDYAFRFCSEDEDDLITANEAIRIFEAIKSEKPKEVSDQFEKLYRQAKSKLFNRKSEVAKDKGIVEALDKLIEIKSKLNGYQDYLDDLYKVISEFDSLPDRYLKAIRGISFSKLEEDFKDFHAEVPHSYLNDIIEKANSIDDGAESLILAEEI
jgi:superfamily II DNA or RNA helicase